MAEKNYYADKWFDFHPVYSEIFSVEYSSSCWAVVETVEAIDEGSAMYAQPETDKEEWTSGGPGFRG